MTYSAPRQGLFAIIILISFCLQTLLLLFSTEHQIIENREQKATRMMSQIADESRLSLENADLVSLSMIANRYTNEQDIAKLQFINNNHQVLVSTGNAQLQQGQTISLPVIEKNAVIGQIDVTLKDISKGEIIAMQWPFVFGSLVIHFILWLIYGYIARPTKQQIKAIFRDVECRYRLQTQSSTNPPKTQNNQSANTTSNQIANYLKTQTNTQANTQDKSTNSQMPADMPNSASDTTKKHTQSNTQNHSVLTTERELKEIAIQIRFYDQFDLLNKIVPEQAEPYFSLCTGLLNQGIEELLRKPLLQGVSLKNKPSFTKEGATVILKADYAYSRLALTSVLLGRLYFMLNDVVYQKNVELKSFALPVKIAISDIIEAKEVRHILQHNPNIHKNDLLILLPVIGIKQIRQHIELKNLPQPTSLYERESALFMGCDQSMMNILVNARNRVLIPNP